MARLRFLPALAILITWSAFIAVYLWIAFGAMADAREAAPAESGEARPGDAQLLMLGRVEREITAEFVCADAVSGWEGTYPTSVARVDLTSLGGMPDAVEPILVVASPVADPSAALARLTSSDRQVTRIELGDRVYRDATDAVAAFETPQAYAQVVEAWVGAIRESAEDTTIAVDVAPPIIGASSRVREWNRPLLPLLREGSLAASVDFFLVNGLEGQQEFGREQARVALGQPQITLRRYFQSEYNSIRTLPERAEIWVTLSLLEPSAEPLVSGTWAESLMMTASYLLLMDDARVRIVCGGGHQLRSTTLALEIIADALEGMEMARSLEMRNVLQIPLPGGGEYRSVLGWRFNGETGTGGLLVNLSADPFAFRLDPLDILPIEFEQWVGEPVQSADLVDGPRSGGVEDGVITLPPYSITRFVPE